jgi:hypothetical protein
MTATRSEAEAAHETRLIADIRSWRERWPDNRLSFAPDEVDLLLRIADERDQLRRDLREEQQGRGRRPVDAATPESDAYVVRTCTECSHAPHGMICWHEHCACRGNGGRS